MTTTVTVKARAHGAVVETDGETINVSPNSERQFHIEEGSQSFSVTQPAEAPAEEENPTPFEGEEVPGRAQNDELVQPVGGKKAKTSSTVGNETGADETAQTTDR
jgi:hypothetical protein